MELWLHAERMPHYPFELGKWISKQKNTSCYLLFIKNSDFVNFPRFQSEADEWKDDQELITHEISISNDHRI